MKQIKRIDQKLLMIKNIIKFFLIEDKLCRNYRKQIFKKIKHLKYSGKKKVLIKADQDFLCKVLVLEEPRKDNFFTHFDRYYLSNRLNLIDSAIDVVNKTEYLKIIQRRRNKIKLVQLEDK